MSRINAFLIHLGISACIDATVLLVIMRAGTDHRYSTPMAVTR